MPTTGASTAGGSGMSRGTASGETLSRASGAAGDRSSRSYDSILAES